MGLIDADELKEKLIKIQDDIVSDIVNQRESRGNAKSDAWKAAYLLVFDEYIKMLDEMPSETYHYICNHDCDALYEAYDKGYSKGKDDTSYDALRRAYLKGREDTINEYKLLEDYCDNDCNATKEAKEMTREETWDKVIQDLKTLDQEARDEEFLPLIISLLVMTAEELHTDVIHSSVKQDDKYHMWSLVDDLGCYSIKGETIMYLPVYQELTELMRKVF